MHNKYSEELTPKPKYIAKGSRVHSSVSHSLSVASGPEKSENSTVHVDVLAGG